jgi:hypothetical protein
MSDAGDRLSRERLSEMEQLRYVLGQMIGLPAGKTELETVWPIHLVLFSNAKEYGPHSLAQPFVEGGSATLGAWTADAPFPRDWLRALTRMLIDDNAGVMPEPLEAGLADLLSTIKVNATHVAVGAPLPAGELSGERMREWAKLQMLATAPEYSGKLRVYLNNLQHGGDENSAVRNAFDMTAAQFNSVVDAYLRAGNFTAAPTTGRAFNPNRDFIEKPVEPAAMNALLAELAAGGKNFPPESPRGLLAKGTEESIRQATKANPRWAEPHFRLAALQTSALAKVGELKTATALAPRNASYWQALAEAQAAADQYADAEKSWAAAESRAPSEAERARIHQARLDLDERRATFEAAELKRIAAEREADLQRVKQAAAAEVHAAESAANARLNSGAKPGVVNGDALPWWSNPQGILVTGSLTRVDCLNGPLRLTIQKDGASKTDGLVRVLIRDPGKLVVEGAKEAAFGCGAQRPVRKVRLQEDGKPDAKLGTAGDVAVIEFP